jgi:hypothetical protein
MENRPSNILILNQERVRVINGGASTSFDDFGVKTQYLFHQTAMT